MTPAEFLTNYESALATQLWSAVSPFIHDEACVTFSNGDFHIGKAAVQLAFERNFTLIQEEQYSISDIHWVQRTDNLAVCIYAFQWSGVINGETASGSGRGTAVLVNQQGNWLLLTEHLGPDNK